MNTYEIFIRDENKNRVAQLEAFTSFVCIRRFNNVGTWVLSASSSALALLTSKRGIEVYRNGAPFFSGDMDELQDDNGQTLTINGFSDEDSLVGRDAYPVPAGAPYLVDYDVRIGAAETIIKQYVDLNAGPDSIPPRAIAGLTIEPDFGRGASITGRARFDNLLTLLQSLAIQGGLGFRVLGMQFQIYVPQDKSGTIVFSKDLGTLGGYSFHEKRATANYVICGGAGTGSSRVIMEMANSGSILAWGRREFFLDKSSTSSASELSAAASEELTKDGDEMDLTFQPLVTAAMRPVDDYDVGDWVAAVIRGQTILQQVRELKTTLDATSGAEVVELAIGTDGATTDLTGLAKVYNRIKKIDKRVNAMERR